MKRILVNERYLGKQIWGQRRFERRPGTRQKVARAIPRAQWHIRDEPSLRIIDLELWNRVTARRAEIRRVLPNFGRTLMRGRCAALHSKTLFSGFMRCGTCGAAATIVHTGRGSPRYGCTRAHQNGLTACDNRITIRAKVADPVLLAGLRAELLEPATVRYVTAAVAAGLNRLIDDRPRLEAEARTAREQAAQRLQRLVAAIESGVSPASLSAAIVQREADLRRLDTELEQFSEPMHQRLAVIPAWVEQQLRDLVGLLSDVPERTKAELRRLDLAIVLHPVRDEGPRPFFRAVATARLPCLAGTRDVALVDRLNRRSAR